jgi:hypothetical protein
MNHCQPSGSRCGENPLDLSNDIKYSTEIKANAVNVATS